MTTTATTAVGGDQVKARIADLLATCDPATADKKTFLGAKYDAGLAWVHFPEGFGGCGAGPKLQALVESELAAAGAPTSLFAHNPIGLGMAAPTLVTHGTDDQRNQFLRELYQGVVWCQLFSEPGAGSDLAALATRAIRDGDEWVVNGQKVWTTLAHVSRYGLLVARTDPDVPKHRGLTYFILDIQAEGVEVRPLRQLTGEAEFNEVYMTDVRIPDSMRLGDVGDGWRVSMTTLMNERVSIGGGAPPRGSGTISLAVKAYQDRRPGPVERDHLMRLWIEAEVARLTNIRDSQMRRVGTPGPEGSVAKIVFAQLNQKITEFCMNTLGADGMLHPPGYAMRRPDSASLYEGQLSYFFLRSRANSIEGGTTEVLKNVTGERVLGLPGEPRVDKDLPWKDVPR